MIRRKFFTRLFGVLSVPASLAVANGQGKGHGKDKKQGRNEGRDDDRESHYFRQQDYSRITQYYGGPRNLPPGLRKKYYRTGTLPPGWQKKMQPFPSELRRQLPPQPPNCEFGYIDGVAVVYDRKTRIILDSIDLVSAAMGH
jgi:hypothetical protein